MCKLFLFFSGRAFIAPSGVQKERVKSSNIFITDLDGNILERPANKELALSQCTPMFLLSFQQRGAGACLHSHSKHAVLATMLNDKEFRIKDMEMIKAIRNWEEKRNYHNYEEIVVPIIENTASEYDLKVTSISFIFLFSCFISYLKILFSISQDRFQKALTDYPATSAVLVRNHGVYVFGPTWESTKSMAESYDYLFELACLMNLHNLRK